VEGELERRVVRGEDFERFLDLWTDAVSAGIEAGAMFPHYLSLSYEALLADPHTEVRRLLEFLDLEASPERVEACVQGASFARLSGGRPAGTEDRDSFFRKGVAGDWIHWLNHDQQVVFLKRAGSLLVQLGYPSTVTP
jgi:hypothetical protein